MKSRRSDEEENSPRKRQRRNNASRVSPASPSPASFQDINADCKVHILSFLSSDDMNSFAECNRECRRIRANETLNQTRTGTIIWRPETTFASFSRKAEEQEWRSVFTGNRTHLRIEGVRSVRSNATSAVTRACFASLLPGVRKLDISLSQHAEEWRPPMVLVEVVRLIGADNLRELDISYLATDPIVLGGFVGFCGQALTRLTCNGTIDAMLLTGEVLRRKNLTHLSVNDSCFLLDHHGARDAAPKEQRDYEVEQEDGNTYMFMHCTSLENLSIKGSTWRLRYADGIDPEPITQAMLIKMVRNHPTLRWLRSDLTAENIAMLKKSVPEVTFVSD